MKRLFLMVLIGTSGCASIIKGRSQEVSFTSNPEGATVTVGGRVIGKTPITTMMKKRSSQPLVFELQNYKPLSMSLETRLEPWFWGNIVCGGLVGSTTDGLSGAINQYSPSQYMVSLQPLDSNSISGNVLKTDNAKIRDFVVLSYIQLKKDIGNGSGEYLSSLLGMLKIPENKKVETTRKIKELSEIYPEIPTFAERVTDLQAK